MVGVLCEVAAASSQNTPTIPYDIFKNALAVQKTFDAALHQGRQTGRVGGAPVRRLNRVEYLAAGLDHCGDDE